MKSTTNRLALGTLGLFAIASMAAVGCSSTADDEATGSSADAIKACSPAQKDCSPYPVTGATRCLGESTHVGGDIPENWCCPQGSANSDRVLFTPGIRRCVWLNSVNTASSCDNYDARECANHSDLEGGIKCGDVASSRMCCPFDTKMLSFRDGTTRCVHPSSSGGSSSSSGGSSSGGSSSGGHGGGGGLPCGRGGPCVE